MNVIVSAAVWVVLNTSIVLGALWLWNRGADHSARQAQRLLLLISVAMIFVGLTPLFGHTVLLQRAFLFAFTLGLVGGAMGVVLDVRDRAQARRQRKDALLRGYPVVPHIIGGWGAFWIGVATYFASGFALLAVGFAWSWAGAASAVINGTPEQWHGLTPDTMIALAIAALIIGILVGIITWVRGAARQRYWSYLLAGIEYREAMATQRATQQAGIEYAHGTKVG